MEEKELIYDWNAAGASARVRPVVELDDETLRDGIQCPSVLDPPIAQKLEILHLMAELGIQAVNLGLPGAGARAVADVTALAREIARAGLRIFPNCAARTVRADVEPIARIVDDTGVPIEAATFIGSSPIRQYAEDWTLDKMLRATEDAVTFAVSLGLPVMYVTEDTTRARPEVLQRLYTTAIECGARRICLADTVGHATPAGARRLVRFIIDEVVRPTGEPVKVDWHGHRDRGLAIPNTLAAIDEGVHRVHGCALGIGERVGNTEMDLLLVNLKLLGLHDGDLSKLPAYVELVSRACGVPVPPNYPVFGEDAFRTGTGVHAAAIIKAKGKGDDWLADRVYSGVPAGLFGRRQRIEVGHMSGMSNVKFWLSAHGYDCDDEALCQRVFELAKRANRLLTDEEMHACCREHGARPVATGD
ncbi:MAG: 2-isopropylmalate synthase [Gemmatimonadetes bacterium]|nr:2-isopropylmalate synthase [Gemmatimonadota bacterium]